MSQGVHRHLTDEEKAQHPGAFTFKQDSKAYHDRNGFEIRPVRATIDIEVLDDEHDQALTEWIGRLGRGAAHV